ncbi:hypothetical protein VCHC47A1_0243, partial [Vibrio cholerae HC-47A1]
MRLLLGNPP